jgi:hypothetical protein
LFYGGMMNGQSDPSCNEREPTMVALKPQRSEGCRDQADTKTGYPRLLKAVGERPAGQGPVGQNGGRPPRLEVGGQAQVVNPANPLRGHIGEVKWVSAQTAGVWLDDEFRTCTFVLADLLPVAAAPVAAVAMPDRTKVRAAFARAQRAVAEASQGLSRVEYLDFLQCMLNLAEDWRAEAMDDPQR